MATINGTQYDDVIKTAGSTYFRNGKKAGNLANSTESAESISTGNGNDSIEAGGGNDTIGGGNGSDTIYGQAGDDVIWGDSFGNSDANDNGQDKLYGGDGNDVIHGGNAKDEIDGGADNDTLYGDNGGDIIQGGTGADVINGGNGGDVLKGGDDTDTDTFVYTTNTSSAVSDSPYSTGAWADPSAPWTKPYDVIVDFQTGEDKIDLSALPLTGDGPSPLVWRGAYGTDASAGQTDSARADGASLAHSVWTADGFLYADINGDGKADLKIQVSDVGFGDLIGVQENDAPVAIADERTATEDEALAAASVLGNDTDEEGDDLDVAAVKVGSTTIVDGDTNDLDGSVNGSIQFYTEAGGTATINIDDGTFSYDQNGVFNSLDTDETDGDSFEYQATDGFLDSGFATVSITVNGVNDAPVTTDDTATTDEDSSVGGTVVDNTTDPDDDVETELTYSVVGDTPEGLTFNDDGTWTFDPSGNYDYLDDDDAPAEVSFDYQANDGDADSNTSTVTITINGVNDAPVTTDDTAATDEDTPVAGTVVDNTTDPDDNVETELTYSVVGDTPAGLTFNDDGTWTFDPSGNYDYLDDGDSVDVTFDYKANDGDDDSNTSTVTITINGVTDVVENQAPTGLKFVPSNSGDGSLGALGSFSATDPDLDVLTYSFSSLTPGFIVDSTTGALTIPDPGGSSTLSTTLTVTATDPDLLSTSQTFNIWVGKTSAGDTTTLSSSDPNIADGRGGVDSITGSDGIDYIFGGAADDTLIGKGEADWLIGGIAVDTYRYLATSDSTSAAFDTILGFVQSPTVNRDKIDLSAIDAIAGSGDDAFTFNGTTATANGVWYAQSGSDVIVYADTTGDTTAELEIHLVGISAVSANDFGASGALL